MGKRVVYLDLLRILACLAVIIIHVAHARVADPTEEIASAVANLLLAQQDVLHLPAAGLELGHQRAAYALGSSIVFA